MVGLTFLAQAGSVQGYRARKFERLRVIAPAIGWDQPGDADDLARPESLEGHGAALRRVQFKGNPSVSDEVEFVGRFTLVEQILACLVADVLRAAADQRTES